MKHDSLVPYFSHDFFPEVFMMTCSCRRSL